MSILDLRLQILPYVETITQEEYNHHKILCIRVERWWSDGTPMDVTKMGFVSLNRVDNKIRPKIGNELIEEHFLKLRLNLLLNILDNLSTQHGSLEP